MPVRESARYLHLGLCKEEADAHAQTSPEGQECPCLLTLLGQPALWAEAVRAQPARLPSPPLIILQAVPQIQENLPALQKQCKIEAWKMGSMVASVIGYNSSLPRAACTAPSWQHFQCCCGDIRREVLSLNIAC